MERGCRPCKDKKPIEETVQKACQRSPSSRGEKERSSLFSGAARLAFFWAVTAALAAQQGFCQGCCGRHEQAERPVLQLGKGYRSSSYAGFLGCQFCAPGHAEGRPQQGRAGACPFCPRDVTQRWGESQPTVAGGCGQACRGKALGASAERSDEPAADSTQAGQDACIKRAVADAVVQIHLGHDSVLAAPQERVQRCADTVAGSDHGSCGAGAADSEPNAGASDANQGRRVWTAQQGRGDQWLRPLRVACQAPSRCTASEAADLRSERFALRRRRSGEERSRHGGDTVQTQRGRVSLPSRTELEAELAEEAKNAELEQTKAGSDRAKSRSPQTWQEVKSRSKPRKPAMQVFRGAGAKNGGK